MKNVAAEKSLLLRAPQTAQMLSVSVSHLWKLVSLGKLPRPLKLGPKMSVWKRRDIEAIASDPERYFWDGGESNVH